MRCVYCGHADSRVLETRATDDGGAIRRRRECLDCGQRFTTFEKVDEMPLWVIKKDGRREQFSGRKVLEGLLRACEKRPVSYERLEQMSGEIERSFRQGSLRREISTVEIGEKVMDMLKDLDGVAYVRFASVYREFKDIGTFMDEIKRLLDNDQRENSQGEDSQKEDDQKEDDQKEGGGNGL
jgi:transcriptional repressor NrdR